jgi:hypothetical protein
MDLSINTQHSEYQHCSEQNLLDQDHEEYYEDEGFFNSKIGSVMVIILIFLFSILIILVTKLVLIYFFK